MFSRLMRRYVFDYDAFASHENALCSTYSTMDGTYRSLYPGGTVTGSLREKVPADILAHEHIDSLDGIRQDWSGRRVWMNPPYGRNILEECMKKAAESCDEAKIIVALIPANTDTRWWHEYVKPCATVYLLRGRVKFIDPSTGQEGGSPPGGSAIAVYTPAWLRGDA